MGSGPWVMGRECRMSLMLNIYDKKSVGGEPITRVLTML